MHRGYTTLVHFFKAIGYRYKSQLVSIHRSGKNGAFTQKDYLAQVLELYILGFLEAFGVVCKTLQFIEDENSVYRHKST
jgi:hypothetical protein